MNGRELHDRLFYLARTAWLIALIYVALTADDKP